MGRFADAVELVRKRHGGAAGRRRPTLLKGLARAKMLSGDGAAAETLFLKLKEIDPDAFDADAELDYARALALQGKNDAAVRQYESVVPRYPGEEARCRFALLLEQLGRDDRAQQYFREILESVKGAPSYYRRRQAEWTRIARQNLKVRTPALTLAANAGDQFRQSGGLLVPLPHRHGGIAGHGFARRHVAHDAALAGDPGAAADGEMVADRSGRRPPSRNRPVWSSPPPRPGRQGCSPSQFHIVTDLDQIIERAHRPDHGVAQRAAIDGAIAADLHLSSMMTRPT